ncbi:(2Fe-2S)-binding protein [bacterium]|nr:(2Fe-2S)-binding protein [bacterium]
MIPIFGRAGAVSEMVNVELRKKTGEFFKTLQIRRGLNLWVALRRFGIPVGASCSGVGVCGKCAIRLVSSDANALSEKSEFETQTLNKQGIDEDLRLSCLCRVNQDVTVSADYW